MDKLKRLIVNLASKEHASLMLAARRQGLTLANLVRRAFGLVELRQGVKAKR